MSFATAELSRELLTRCRFPPPGTAVVCGVSGGADSSALLLLAVEAGLHVEAVHVDHQLRADGEAEAERVRVLAERVGSRFRSERIEVADGPDLEARCRRARREVLGEGALTGHTMDDQAETVLWHLVRGSGLDGVAGMRIDTHPLLGLRRHETRELCALYGLDVFEDPSNHSVRFTRNRIRHEVLPLLDDVAGRDVVPVIDRFTRQVRIDADHLDALASLVDPADAPALTDAPEAIARRAVRRWIASADPDGHPPSSAAVDRILAVARLEARSAEVEGGIRVERHRQRLSLHRSGPGR